MSDPVYLLDSSVLIALASTTHDLHDIVTNWMGKQRPAFATCPITQGALLRISMRVGGLTFSEAQKLLGSIVQHAKHTFVADTVSYYDIEGIGILGHQQVTDGYLAQLARSTGMKLATLDRAQAALHADVAELLS